STMHLLISIIKKKTAWSLKIITLSLFFLFNFIIFLHPISIVHCSSELLSSNHPPPSASRKLGLQAHATTPGRRLQHKSTV
uniref:Uncharacterized protein n=1 Tax=Oryzias melastigma TaxID=30732 RepID=A0A3B3DM87_ORYME